VIFSLRTQIFSARLTIVDSSLPTPALHDLQYQWHESNCFSTL